MRLVLLALAVSLVIPAIAGAQRSNEQQARRFFEQANEALATGRFAEARDLLRRSLEAHPNAASAFNLAVALRGTGEPLAAAAMFDRVLEGDFGELSAPQRREATRLRAEARAEIGVLHIGARGADEIEIRVDGERVSTVADGEQLRWEVDPGLRVVTATAPRRETIERRIEVERGGSTRLSFELVPSEDARVGTLIVEAAHPEDVLEIVGVARGTGTLRRELSPGEYEVQVSGPAGSRESVVELEAGTTLRVRLERESGGVFSSPWFWGAVGVVVAGLAVGGVLLFGETTASPVQDDVYGVITTLSTGERR